jgi:hypothetical protein
MRITDGLTADGNLKTDGKTHATTGKVVGTGPYRPWEYSGCGHVSEMTDAFAMGIVIIELLIFGSVQTNAPEGFPFKARDLVNTEEAADLTALIQARAVSSGWAEGNAKRAAEILANVAVVCTQKTGKRQTPAEVMGQLESARALAR